MFLDFLFQMPPFWAIFLVSFVIVFVTTIVYKYTTDQKRMKSLKDQSKKFQEKMKASRDDPNKMMKIQGEAMKVNFELMKHSLKPTLYTMIPILIIFWWLNAHFAYLNIAPQQEFTLSAEFAKGIAGDVNITFVPSAGVTLASDQIQPVKDQKAEWRMKADGGTYKAILSFGGASIEKQFLITDARDYTAPVQAYKGAISRVTVGYEPVKPFGKTFNIFGWHPGWLATYILLSIGMSIGLRKAFNVV